MAEPKKQLDNQEDLSHDTQYYTAKPLDKRELKRRIAYEKAKEKYDKKKHQDHTKVSFLISLSFLFFLIAVVSFFIDKNRNCGSSCGAVSAVLIFSIYMTIYSISLMAATIINYLFVRGNQSALYKNRPILYPILLSIPIFIALSFIFIRIMRSVF